MKCPYPIKFEKRKPEQYLTISCIISNPGTVKEIQDELWNELLKERIEGIKFIENTKDLYPDPKHRESLDNFIIYKYPIENDNRIHFSLFVILTRTIDNYLEFNDEVVALKQNDFFKDLKEEIKKLAKKISSDSSFIKKGQVKRIYFPHKIENSIALNVYMPCNFQYLKNLEGQIKNKFKKYSLEGEVKLKMYNEEYFAMNLIRFIHKDKNDCFKNSCIYKKIKEINKKLEESPIDVEFKVRPTISDPYLSNKEPFLDE